jgi:hypothetical protein
MESLATPERNYPHGLYILQPSGYITIVVNGLHIFPYCFEFLLLVILLQQAASPVLDT